MTFGPGMKINGFTYIHHVRMQLHRSVRQLYMVVSHEYAFVVQVSLFIYTYTVLPARPGGQAASIQVSMAIDTGMYSQSSQHFQLTSQGYLSTFNKLAMHPTLTSCTCTHRHKYCIYYTCTCVHKYMYTCTNHATLWAWAWGQNRSMIVLTYRAHVCLELERHCMCERWSISF